MTNFDKLKEEIKDMTPEEFIRVYYFICDKIPDEMCNKHTNCDDCDECVLEYLKSEVK